MWVHWQPLWASHGMFCNNIHWVDWVCLWPYMGCFATTTLSRLSLSVRPTDSFAQWTLCCKTHVRPTTLSRLSLSVSLTWDVLQNTCEAHRQTQWTLRCCKTFHVSDTDRLWTLRFCKTTLSRLSLSVSLTWDVLQQQAFMWGPQTLSGLRCCKTFHVRQQQHWVDWVCLWALQECFAKHSTESTDRLSGL